MAGSKKAATAKATKKATTTTPQATAGEQACPRCGATGDEPCRHPSGRVRGGGRRHKERDAAAPTTPKARKEQDGAASPMDRPCPFCKAAAGERCVSPNGARWTGGHTHKARKEA
jgi:hypothetical protein